MADVNGIATTSDTIVHTIVKQPITVNDGALILVVLLIAALGLMFYLVFRWMQRAEQAGYLGQLYRDSVFEFEKGRLSQRVEQRRAEGEFRSDAIAAVPWTLTPPKVSVELNQLILDAQRKRQDTQGVALLYSARPGGYVPPGLPGLTGLPGMGGSGIGGRNSFGLDEIDLQELPIELDGEGQKLVDRHNREVREYNDARNAWRERVRQKEDSLYRTALSLATSDAGIRAEQALDVDMGIFRGRGPAFVLEFTAIVVIIFAAVILGILGPLDGQQIGTLLAAIAGYVLGKATADTKKDDKSAPSNKGGSDDTATKDNKQPPAPNPAEPAPSANGKANDKTVAAGKPAADDHAKETGQTLTPAADAPAKTPDAPPPKPQPSSEAVPG